MYEVRAYSILLEAVTPIAHHSEVFGNHAVVARRKVRAPDGSWTHVPAISGDTMRHGLREASAYAFLDACGLLQAGNLTEAALRLLFSGGMVTAAEKAEKGAKEAKKASNIKLDDYRTMCDLIPPLALLGGCASNRVIPGRVVSEDAMLVCEESRHLVPAWMLERAGVISSGRAAIEIQQRVRMDASLDPVKAKLLAGGAAEAARERLLKSERAAETGNAIEREEAKSSMLPRTFESIAAGSLFAWRVQATCTSELDSDTFHAMIGAFLSSARVGGKRATGFGLIRPVAANSLTIGRPADSMQAVDVTALGPRIGELFRQHVRERAEQAKAFLQKVNA